MQEKVVFFLDYANINRAAVDKRLDLDYSHLLQYISEGRFLVDAHCYVPIDPRNEHRLDKELEYLWRCGYVVTTKRGTIAGPRYKCDFDIEIAIDVLNTVYQIKPDIIVIATGDVDFIPLVLQVRKLGVRVETASFRSAASSELVLKSSGFIDLDVYYEEYLNDEQIEPDESDVLNEKLVQEQLDDEEEKAHVHSAESSDGSEKKEEVAAEEKDVV
jgi:uncharacterized LabA/DUF88 family protein